MLPTSSYPLPPTSERSRALARMNKCRQSGVCHRPVATHWTRRTIVNNTAACSKRTRNPGYGHVRSYCRKKLQRTAAAAAAAAVSIRAGMPSCSMGLQGHLLDTPARYLQAGFQHQKGFKRRVVCATRATPGSRKQSCHTTKNVRPAFEFALEFVCMRFVVCMPDSFLWVYSVLGQKCTWYHAADEGTGCR